MAPERASDGECLAVEIAQRVTNIAMLRSYIEVPGVSKI